MSPVQSSTASASQAKAPWLTKPFGSSKLAAAIRSNASSRAGVASLMSSSSPPAYEPLPAPVPAVDSPLDTILPTESVPRQAARDGCTGQHHWPFGHGLGDQANDQIATQIGSECVPGRFPFAERGDGAGRARGGKGSAGLPDRTWRIGLRAAATAAPGSSAHGAAWSTTKIALGLRCGRSKQRALQRR